MKQNKKRQIIKKIIVACMVASSLTSVYMASAMNYTDEEITIPTITAEPTTVVSTTNVTIEPLTTEPTTEVPSTEPTTEAPTEETTTKVPTTEAITEAPDVEATNVSVATQWQGAVLTPSNGVVEGPSGRETYYNLDMSGVISIMRSNGYEYEYWVRDDGVKMFGEYVMCAANFNIRPRGTIIETSLGIGIVCDTGGFAEANPTQLDIAVNW